MRVAVKVGVVMVMVMSREGVYNVQYDNEGGFEHGDQCEDEGGDVCPGDSTCACRSVSYKMPTVAVW